MHSGLQSDPSNFLRISFYWNPSPFVNRRFISLLVPVTKFVLVCYLWKHLPLQGEQRVQNISLSGRQFPSRLSAPVAKEPMFPVLTDS
jgi:hypothetical protein